MLICKSSHQQFVVCFHLFRVAPHLPAVGAFLLHRKKIWIKHNEQMCLFPQTVLLQTLGNPPPPSLHLDPNRHWPTFQLSTLVGFCVRAAPGILHLSDHLLWAHPRPLMTDELENFLVLKSRILFSVWSCSYFWFDQFERLWLIFHVFRVMTFPAPSSPSC